MNSPSPRDLLLLPLLSLCAALPQARAAAQDPIDAASVVPTAALRVPIHERPGGEGTWAAGPDFKASFHDGFAFYPVLGSSYPHNLPLRWSFASAAVGGTPLADAAATPRHSRSAWRYEYDHGGIEEVYDVRADGVAQSFVIERRPPATGDLVIAGTVATPLHCEPATSGHRALVFRDRKGTPVVRYGEAFAIDADGDRIEAATAFDGERVSLTVPAGWLAEATFPIVVDPLTSSLLVAATLNGQSVGACDVGQHSETTTRNVMVAFERIVSANDRDVYGLLVDTDYSNPLVVMSHLTTSDSYHVSVAYVAGANRWTLGYVQGGHVAHVYFHNRLSTALNSGPTAAWGNGTTFAEGIDLGGTHSGSTGQHGIGVVWYGPDRIRIHRIDALAGTMDVFAFLGASGSFERGRPSVNQVAGNSLGNDDGWLVVYQERNLLVANDDVDLVAARIDSAVASATLPVQVVNGGTRNVFEPRVSGVSGYYTLSYLASTDLGSTRGATLHARRIVWAPAATSPGGIGSEATIATAAPGSVSLGNHGLAVNHEISTTAVAVFTRRNLLGSVTAHAARLTSGGAPVDTHQLSVPSGQVVAPAVAFAMPGQDYQIVCGATGHPHPVFGWRYEYPADAIEALYGVGCGPMQIGGHRPYLGNAHYQVSGHSGPPGTLAALSVGTTPAANPLDGIGMPGCMGNVNQILGYLGTTDATGLVTFPVPLPETFLLPYDLRFQVVYVSPGSNTLGVQATRGLLAQVR